MRGSLFIRIALAGIGALLFSCSTQEDDLDLAAGYLQVSDALEYCQGQCGEALGWEGSPILVKGHIPDVENEAAMEEAYAQGRIFLHDIRNGLFLEVQVTGDRDAVFHQLGTAARKDQVFLKGMAESVIVNEGNECMKGLVVVLTSAQDIQFNL